MLMSQSKQKKKMLKQKPLKQNEKIQRLKKNDAWIDVSKTHDSHGW